MNGGVISFWRRYYGHPMSNKSTFLFLCTAGFLAALTPAANANDGSAELATGGLVFVKNNDVEILSEDLFISTDEIRVRYRFFHRSNSDVTSLVAFPLPDLKIDLDDDVTVIPTEDPVNFVGFATTVDGQHINARAEQRADINNQDKTDVLTRLGIPLSPYVAQQAIEKMKNDKKTQLRRQGLMNEDGLPLWRLKTRFYWQQRFPSRREIIIEHHYKPSVGSLVGVDGPAEVQILKDPQFGQFDRKYCIEPSLLRELGENKADNFSQQRIEYVLKTGASWAGPIREFRLVVDKGSQNNFVSFCGANVKKIGPTTFEARINNFTPRNDLAILILKQETKNPDENGAQKASPPADPTPSTVDATSSCDQLWSERNNIFKAAGYCFKNGRAVQVFGNAGCLYDDERNVPLSDNQRQKITEITQLESSKGCQ